MTNIQNPGDFPNPEEKQPVAEVKIGEWFTPFPDYANTPYEALRDDHRSKRAFFRVNGIGDQMATLEWTRTPSENEEIKTRTDNVLVALPSGAKIIQGNMLPEEESIVEARLMGIDIEALDDNVKFPYRVGVRLPDGTEATLLTVMLGPEKFYPDFFEGEIRHGERDGESIGQIVIPEIATIVEKVQIRFESKAGDDK